MERVHLREAQLSLLWSILCRERGQPSGAYIVENIIRLHPFPMHHSYVLLLLYKRIRPHDHIRALKVHLHTLRKPWNQLRK